MTTIFQPMSSCESRQPPAGRETTLRYLEIGGPIPAAAETGLAGPTLINVEALVEGEVLKTERRMRITAQLIETATDSHLWAETYERDLRDAVLLQGEVAESIAGAIRTKVTGRTRKAGWQLPR